MKRLETYLKKMRSIAKDQGQLQEFITVADSFGGVMREIIKKSPADKKKLRKLNSLISEIKLKANTIRMQKGSQPRYDPIYGIMQDFLREAKEQLEYISKNEDHS